MDEQSKIIKRLKITLAPCASDGGKTGLRFAWACFFFFFSLPRLYIHCRKLPFRAMIFLPFRERPWAGEGV